MPLIAFIKIIVFSTYCNLIKCDTEKYLIIGKNPNISLEDQCERRNMVIANVNNNNIQDLVELLKCCSAYSAICYSTEMNLFVVLRLNGHITPYNYSLNNSNDIIFKKYVK
ncbi:hypothetical protein DMUE_0536 [Dictyocoela muelleri]|nr:hypothetical protein DMUE_0536 [Dictyocoela muelleri]